MRFEIASIDDEVVVHYGDNAVGRIVGTGFMHGDGVSSEVGLRPVLLVKMNIPARLPCGDEDEVLINTITVFPADCDFLE
jgi:hypothetical protein